MLEGVRANEIVMGAYTDNDGGICPMLAAHRNGGRTTFLAFAKAWDRLGGPTAARRTRRATERELRILTSQLEASLMAEEPTDLSAAIAEYEAARARSGAARPSSPAIPPEIQAGRLTPVSGVRRLRPARRRDEAAAEAALTRVERALERDPQLH
ncbi:MAG: hypothetical protein AVDCRST_MAG30-319 [uncultured Solirubrobacteraceae bacterium]|uniref:Uncharacterized protein n=1 Tax=uncultured Solirubrobacteraceae bacterium TaxID=1162706 RepID=A0A6J4RI07_9ACTN|nr:MAG: hypothetical protein AVDCRST_MAG30-319 [uncultured Solirubrobacteraceae bacterium]